MSSRWGESTRSVHLRARKDPVTGAIVPPISQSAAYAFDDLESWRRVALGESDGDTYGRNSNPTSRLLVERVAALEGAETGASFATGMAAITTSMFALLDPGKRAVTIRDAYGATFLMFTEILPRFGIECVVCDTDDTEGLEREIATGCDLLYLETPTNPVLKVLDIAALSALAHEQGALVLVDNTFATPVNQRPLELGADLVIHSATKYLGGHNDVLGGIVCGRSELIEPINRHRELTGAALDPHSAFLLLRSLKTLGLRIARHNENAQHLATFLQAHARVEQVFYPGLESHPRHQLACRQMRGFGGVLSFTVEGGMEAAGRVLSSLRLAYLAPNLGQVETIAGPAALTSHVELSAEQIEASGVPASLIRYATGIEDAEDLQADLEQALGRL